MATRKSKPNAGLLKKAPTELHEGLAEFINTTVAPGLVDAETVALVQRAYPLYTKSPAVQKAREAERRAREAEKAEREAARKARLQERLDKIEAERRKVLEALGLEAMEVPEPVADEEEPEVSVESGEVPDEEADESEAEVEVTEDEDEWEDDDETEEDF